MPKAPSVKQEATDATASPYAKTPTPTSSPSKNKGQSPKKNGTAAIEPVDDMANKKYQIMTMVFEAAKSLRSEDIAEKVGLTPLQVKNLLQVGRPSNLRYKVLDKVARGEC